jgi:hypothetical protein
MSKFGIEIRDTATFLISRMRWEDTVGAGRSNYLQLPNRPSEGDLLYMPLTKSYFEIKKVDATNPFFQLGKLHTYKLMVELWQYSSEELNTGVAEIDSLEDERSLATDSFQLLLEAGDRLVLNTNSYEDISYLLKEDFKIQNIDATSDNQDFTNEALDILDFSEINPFGEVIRNV